MSPTEVKVTLIPPPGKAIEIKSPDALVQPVPARHMIYCCPEPQTVPAAVEVKEKPAPSLPDQRYIRGFTSVPIPKFASLRGTLVCELRNQRDTRNL
jgi:hypothetical protein